MKQKKNTQNQKQFQEKYCQDSNETKWMTGYFGKKEIKQHLPLKDYCRDQDIGLVSCNMSSSDFYDEKRMNEKGIRYFVRCVKRIIKRSVNHKY